MADGAAYQRIANELAAAIEAGDFAEGERLPSVRTIAEQYRVARATAERALDTLRARGLTAARRGSGHYVHRYQRIVRRSPGRLSRRQWGTGKAIQDHDTEPRPRSVDVVVGETPAPGFVADALGMTFGEAVLFRSRTFVIDDRPVQLSVSYLPLDIARGTGIEYTDTGPGGTYARLADAGHAPTRFTEHVVVRRPTDDEAAAMTLTHDEARVYQVTRCAFDKSGRCVEVNRMVLDAYVYELEYSFQA